MATTKPFRFGVMGSGATPETFGAVAREAEALGYSVFLCTDHLDLSGSHFNQLSPLPALVYAATVTSEIRLGVSVLNQDLRHPAVVAQEAATVDILSHGRLELGLGAGWAEYEYRWAGIPFDRAGVRIDRFEEYVAVVDSLLRNEQTTFSGASYQIDGMPGFPRPAQDPRPPLMIGGTGKRMLSFAARNADIVGINLGALDDPTPEAMDKRVEWIRAAAGDRLDAIELNNIVGTLVVAEGDRRAALQAELERMSAAGRDFINEGIDEEAVLASPTALIGSVGSLAEQLHDWRERWGISYVILPHAMMRDFAPVIERLA